MAHGETVSKGKDLGLDLRWLRRYDFEGVRRARIFDVEWSDQAVHVLGRAPQATGCERPGLGTLRARRTLVIGAVAVYRRRNSTGHGGCRAKHTHHHRAHQRTRASIRAGSYSARPTGRRRAHIGGGGEGRSWCRLSMVRLTG